MQTRAFLAAFGLVTHGVAAPAPSQDWKRIAVPGAWEDNAQIDYDGVVWYRCWANLPKEWRGRDITLVVERVDNAHEAYVNGRKVGGAGAFPPDYRDGLDEPGRYAVPADQFRFDDWNHVAIRVYDHEGRGGFKGKAPRFAADGKVIKLEGLWEFRIGDDLRWAKAPPDAQPASATFAKLEEAAKADPSGHEIPKQDKPLPPAQSAKLFTVPDDLEIEQVLAEPIVAQPVHLSFDERGRLWVVQYRQYPAPAGLNVVSKDVFWRAVYDKVPPPPPNHFRGDDKITIHEDTDGDGRYDKHTTFVEGLNIATACAKGRGGVWVLNPPYLLFYPDANNDDVPDGPPVVHLEGFGLEDTHSVVNSLRWGPDGWLYAAQGSTVTAKVRVRGGESPVPPHPGPLPQGEGDTLAVARSAGATGSHDAPPHESPSPRGEGRGEGIKSRAVTGGVIYSQGQNIWRYHPEKHFYEIFAEGGGNAFGVEIDPQGRIFSGHNGGDTRGFHYMQGAYLRKGFEKHGELSNPYAFGYFPQMEGSKTERFTHTFVIYHGGALPTRYEGKLFGVEPLQGRVVMSEILPDGSTFKTRDLQRVVTNRDQWFRPVEIKVGPDGAIYIADWYDRQVTHTRNQEGQIDRSNGRIYRLKAKGARPGQPFNLATNSSVELVGLLSHRNDWYRQTALRLLADRTDASVVPGLRGLLAQGAGALALEALWALGLSGGFDESFAHAALEHRDPFVRLWAVRLLGDNRKVSTRIAERFRLLAATERNVEVRAQLACTVKRLPGSDALPIVAHLLRRDEDAHDPRLPLLCWWAIEAQCESNHDAVIKLFEDSTLWTEPMVEQHILARLMRRFAAAGTGQDLLTCARLLQLSPTREHSLKLMAGFEEAFKGRSIGGLPDELIQAMARHNVGSDAFKLRTGDPKAIDLALHTISDAKARAQHRLEFIEVLGEVHPVQALPALLQVAERDNNNPALRKAALGALLGYDDARIASTVIKSYSAYPKDLRTAALTLLCSRAGWSWELAQAVEAGRLQAADVPLDAVRQIQRHKGEELAGLVAKHWPQLGRPSTAEMEQQMQRLATVVRGGSGDPYNGQKLFSATCGACHRLFNQGGEIGPDLTPYQRSDLDTLLLHIVNPSAEIREGYENFVIETRDERSLTGFLVERDDHMIVLRGMDGQNVRLPRSEVQELRPAGLSLMPEGLLEGMDDRQVRDLFAYLRSTQPLPN